MTLRPPPDDQPALLLPFTEDYTDDQKTALFPPGTVLDGSGGTDAEVYARSQSWEVASACLFACDHGAGKPFTLDEAAEKVGHPLSFLAGKQKQQHLLEVVAYLACQVVGYAHSQNADAKLAMNYIRDRVHDYETALHARPDGRTGLPQYSDLGQDA